MTSLENKVLQCASGEKRLNPDELRQYFGTYAERVVLAVLLENAEKKTVIDHFPQILKDLQAVYPNLSLKLSPKLADQIQFTYIKTAQALNISATIVDEAKAHSVSLCCNCLRVTVGTRVENDTLLAALRKYGE